MGWRGESTEKNSVGVQTATMLSLPVRLVCVPALHKVSSKTSEGIRHKDVGVWNRAQAANLCSVIGVKAMTLACSLRNHAAGSGNGNLHVENAASNST